MGVEPVHGRPAATVTADGQQLLVVADYHAGIESVLRTDGVEIETRAERRRFAVPIRCRRGSPRQPAAAGRQR